MNRDTQLQDVIPMAIGNNPEVAVAMANEKGINVTTGKQLSDFLVQLWNNNEQAFVIEFLNLIPVVQKNDPLNSMIAWAKSQGGQKANFWDILGGALEGIGNALTGGNNQTPPPPPPPPPTFFQKYGVTIIVGVALGGLLLYAIATKDE